jgi:rhodanese-related sulfurtransferase
LETLLFDQIPEVDPATAHTRQTQVNAVVLDVRELDELKQIRVSNATHIPLNELPARAGEISRDSEIYVLCHVGQRSAMATAMLHQWGYTHVWNIQGGIVGWLRSGLPAEWGETA